MKCNKLVGLTGLALATGAFAQQPAQQTTSSTTQQTPSATQTATTRSTTTAMPGTPNTPAQTETTTTRSTTTTPTDPTGTPTGPSQSSTTTSTTTTSPGAPQPATAADVKTGVGVYDASGGVVGKIVSVSGKNAVLNTGSVRAIIPLASFAKNDKGLVIGMTKAQIDAEAKKAAPKRK